MRKAALSYAATASRVEVSAASIAVAQAAFAVAAASHARVTSTSNASTSTLLQDKSCGNKMQEKWESMGEIIGMRVEFSLSFQANLNHV
jgi:hypothetical protein